MSALARALLAELDDDALADALGPGLAPLFARTKAPAWLNSEHAAAYRACSRGRLCDLVELGKLEPSRDGRRLPPNGGDLEADREAC
jgi:hypothetical protein